MRPWATLALLLAALTGCGGGDGGDEVSPDLVVQAVTKTQRARGVQIEFASTSTVEAGGDEATAISGTGTMDLGERRGRLELDMSDLAYYLQQAGEEADPADFQVELRLVGERFFTRFPYATKRAGSDREWIVQGTEEDVGPGGVDFAQLARINGNDIPRTFEDLNRVRDVKRTGEPRTIAGAETTHYDGTVDLADAPDADAFESLVGDTSYPADVWIDGRGLIRRLEWEVEHKVSTADPDRVQGSKRTVAVNLVRFGVPVRVEVPPPSEVTSESAFSGGVP